jgi:hypothetical protein
VATAGALVVCFTIGMAVGRKTANRSTPGGGYEPISNDSAHEKRRSATIN